MVILLTEITVKDAYTQHYSKIDSTVYSTIIKYAQGEGQQILLPNTKWVLKLYLKDSVKTLQELHYLEDGTVFKMFNRLKDMRILTGRAADINSYASIYDLCSMTKQFNPEDLEGDNTERKKRILHSKFIEARDEIQKVYEDEEWLVVIPKSYEASVYWGNNTDWCTAYKDSSHYYVEYASKGPLYININKQTGEKYQFHFPSRSFMDESDSEIYGDVMKRIYASEGLNKFYKEHLSSRDYSQLTKNSDAFNIIGELEDDYRLVERTSVTQYTYPDWIYSYNIIDINSMELRLPYGFDSYENVQRHKGLIISSSELGDNFVDYGGSLFFSEWGDGVNWSPNSDLLIMLSRDGEEMYVYENNKNNFWFETITYNITEILRRGELYVVENSDFDESNVVNLKTCSFIYDEWVEDMDCKLLANTDILVTFDEEYGLRKTNITNGEIEEVYVEEDYDEAKLLNDKTFAIRLFHDRKWMIYDMESSRPRFNSAQFDYVINNNDTCYLTLLGYHNKWNIMGRKGAIVFPDIWFDEIVPKVDMHYRGRIYFKAKIGNKDIWIDNYGNIYEYNSKLFTSKPNLLSKSRYHIPDIYENNTYSGEYSILKESSHSLILEISVPDAYSKYYKDIDNQTFATIIHTIQGDNNNVLLPDTKWVLKMYRNEGDEMMGKLEEIKTALSIFGRMRERQMLPAGITLEICQSTSDLISFTERVNHDEVFKRTANELSKDIKKAKNDIEVLFDDDNWLVLIPRSMEASMYWGSDTKWCTATRNEENNMYEHYTENGPLFININKQTGEKYQFHFGDNEFNDGENKPIKLPVLKNIDNVSTLADFYEEYTKKDKKAHDCLFVLDWEFVGEWELLSRWEVRRVYRDGLYNLVNRDFELLSKVWFKYIDGLYPNNASAIVELDGRYFVFSVPKKTFIGDSYDEIWGFQPTDMIFSENPINYISIVKNNGKYNLINGNGKLLSPIIWFDEIEEDWQQARCAKAIAKGETYIIDYNGRILKQ